MQQSTIPGYSEIFPHDSETYEELVKDISSDTLLKLCAAIDNELTCPEDRKEIQGRLNYNIVARFTTEQKKAIFKSFHDYKLRAGNGFKGMIFFRRYLISMMLKELNNYREIDDLENLPVHEYNFFKAYLHIIDEVNFGDHGDVDFNNLDKNEPLTKYQLLWVANLRQFEYNERGNFIFDTLKTACLLKYFSSSYKSYLKEYLKSFNFKSPGELLESYNQIYGVTEAHDPKAMFHKYSLINPDFNVSTKHLDAQTINYKIGGKLSFSDLKKHTIFFSKQRGKYIILDNYLAQRKMFRGPFFELYHSTTLHNDTSFNKYSQNISAVFEKTCLCPVLTMLGENSADILQFDDGSDSVPDGYLRIGNKIFLFEYKAYIFPERYSQNPDLNDLKEYFDEHFISTKKNQPKGISQLKKQIELIYEGKFSFDPDLENIIKEEKLTIYPIITYNDFYFSMPGLNGYLNDAFVTLLDNGFDNKLSIMPLTLMNLESILDMVLCGQDLFHLEEHIINYFSFLNQCNLVAHQSRDTSYWLQAHSSFDEIYNWLLKKKSAAGHDIQPLLRKLLDLAGISFDELNKEI